MKKLVSTMRKGFQMTFDNGLTASVQWGAGNYCDNRNTSDFGLYLFSKDAESNTAEVAVIYNGELINITPFLTNDQSNDGEVAGWLTPSEIVDFLVRVRDAKIV